MWIGSKTLHRSLFHAVNMYSWRWVSEELFGLAGASRGMKWEVQWVRLPGSFPGVSVKQERKGKQLLSQCQSLVWALQMQAGKLHRRQEALHFDFPVSLWLECKYTLRTLIPLDPALLESLLEDPVALPEQCPSVGQGRGRGVNWG